MKKILGVFLIIALGLTAWLKDSYNQRVKKIAESEAKSILDIEAKAESQKVIEKPKTVLTQSENFNQSEQAIIDNIKLYFNTGDFAKAVELAEKALKEKHSKELILWLKEQMPAILISKGWAELKLGHCQKTIETLSKAEKYSKTIEGAKALAYCYMKLGHLIPSENYLNWLIDSKAVDGDTLLMYAEVSESSGQFNAAIRMIEDHLDQIEDKQSLKDLQERLKDLKKKAKAGQNQLLLSSKNFILSYHGEAHDGAADQILEYLETSLAEYIEKYGFQEVVVPFEVVLYLDGSFQNVLNNVPVWAEGLFDGRMRIPVKKEWLRGKNIDRMFQVLRHELVHALLSQKTGDRRLPAWFEEGLAQKLSCEQSSCLQQLLSFSSTEFLELTDFENSFLQYEKTKVKSAYEQSLFLILFIESQQSDGIKELISYIGVNSKLSSDEILKPISTNFEQLHGQAKKMWQQKKLLIE